MSVNTDSLSTRPRALANILDPPGAVPTADRLKARLDRGKPMLNQYTRWAKVGGGQHGEVYLCFAYRQKNVGDPDTEPRYPVAMKSVKRDNPRAERWKKFQKRPLPTSPHLPVGDRLGTTETKIRKEIAIMKKCRHAHVVRLFEVIDDRLKDKIYMVMEYLGGGEVKWRNEKQEPILTVDQTKRIMRDAILGLEYLHYQGIIHRDIKPANLLWTADRQQVKIGDFGVSHFSYAQRLAGAGRSDSIDDPCDPILLDDSELTKRAGTPSFLAPEVIFEHTVEPSPLPSSSSVPTSRAPSLGLTSTTQTLSPSSTIRPPITKSIDIWALGVTLYCFLFGRTPFLSDPSIPSSEYSLYNVICNNDWSVDDTMGFDQVRTGGRRPTVEKSEGAIIIHLLDRFLTKDVRYRITLEEVKKYVWFHRDLSDPENWIRMTSPSKIDVSEVETSDAMSSVHFRWNWGAQLTRRISSLFRIRPQRSRDHLPGNQNDYQGVSSAPSSSGKHYRHAASGMHRQLSSDLAAPPTSGSKREKGKRRADVRAPKEANSKATRSKSIERWPADSSSSMRPAPKARRGSETGLAPRNFSSQSSPTAEDRPRTRFTMYLASILHWKPNKYPLHDISPADTPPLSADLNPNQTLPPADHLRRPSRRSEEALRHRRSTQSNSSGPMTFLRRASSWGENASEFLEVTSMNSDAHDLDEQAMSVGAGGVSNDLPYTDPNTAVGMRVSTSPPAHEEVYDADMYGPQCIETDSSTIASSQLWQNGEDLDDHCDDDSDDDDPGLMITTRRRDPLPPHHPPSE